MEIIDISGYIAEEKLAIAKQYLIPQIEELTGRHEQVVMIVFRTMIGQMSPHLLQIVISITLVPVRRRSQLNVKSCVFCVLHISVVAVNCISSQ